VIKRVLEAMLKPGVMSKHELARRVGIQPETLDDIIRLLVDREYLLLEEGKCEVSDSCTKCRMRGTCEMITDFQIYRITERGARYARGEGS